MQLIIKVDVDNAAFEYREELEKVLNHVVNRYWNDWDVLHGKYMNLHDSNGNTCGVWKLTE